MKIYIPTLGRVDNQITYENLPTFLKKITSFVIQPKEVELFKEKYPNVSIKVLPEDDYGICNTRMWILNNAGDEFYWMVDDDMKFIKRHCNRRTGKKNAEKSNTPFVETDWVDMINWVKAKWEDGNTIVGNRRKGLPPAPKAEIPFSKLVQSFFINGSKLNANNIVLDIPFVEDVQFIFQVLEMGGKITVSDEYLFDCDNYGSEGGCTLDGRTGQINLDNMIKLAERYPKYITMKDEIIKLNDDLLYQKHTIHWSKAYNPFYGTEIKYW